MRVVKVTLRAASLKNCRVMWIFRISPQWLVFNSYLPKVNVFKNKLLHLVAFFIVSRLINGRPQHIRGVKVTLRAASKKIAVSCGFSAYLLNWVLTLLIVNFCFWLKIEVYRTRDLKSGIGPRLCRTSWLPDQDWYCDRTEDFIITSPLNIIYMSLPVQTFFYKISVLNIYFKFKKELFR